MSNDDRQLEQEQLRTDILLLRVILSVYKFVLSKVVKSVWWRLKVWLSLSVTVVYVLLSHYYVRFNGEGVERGSRPIARWIAGR